MQSGIRAKTTAQRRPSKADTRAGANSCDQKSAASYHGSAKNHTYLFAGGMQRAGDITEKYGASKSHEIPIRINRHVLKIAHVELDTTLQCAQRVGIAVTSTRCKERQVVLSSILDLNAM